MFNLKILLSTIRTTSIFIFSFILVLLSLSFAAISQLVSLQISDAEVINIAGKQRMLSQKIALNATQLVTVNNSTSKAELLQSLNNSVDLMASNHDLLINGQDKVLVLNRNYYFKGDDSLNDQLQRFFAVARSLTKAKSTREIEALFEKNFQSKKIEQLLLSLDSIVTHLELASKQQVQALKNMLLILWVICLVLCTFIFVFSYRRIQKQALISNTLLNNERNRINNFQTAINQHSLVFRVNAMGEIQYVNKRFCQVLGHKKEEIINKHFSVLSDSFKSNTLLTEVTKVLSGQDEWRQDLCFIGVNGRSYWLETSIVKSENDDDNFIIIQHDVTKQKNTVYSLNELHRITSSLDLDLSQKIEQLLTLGCEVFHLPFGIVSRIDGEVYHVEYAHSPENELVPGSDFNLGETYCFHTLNANEPKAFHYVKHSEIKNHPCYKAFGLESYIGVPLHVNGKPFGTLNFSSPEPSTNPFSRDELELIQLFSQWLGHELTKEQQQDIVHSQKLLMDQMSEQAKIGAWEVNLLTNEVTWSSMTKKIHEVEPEYQPRLDTAINFYKEGKSRETIQALVEQSMLDGKFYKTELELVTAKGRNIWVAAHGNSEFIDGKCVKLYGSFQDITEQVKARQALAESNYRLAFVMESTAVGIWDWDIPLDSAVINARWAGMLGYKLEELTPVNSSTWQKLIHPDDLALSTQALKTFWESGDEFYSNEFRMLHKSGHWVWVLDTGKTVEWLEDSQPKRMIGTHLDITAGKLAEEKIQEANRRMGLAADSAGIGVWEFNLSDNSLIWDEWMYKLYGVDANSFSGAIEAWENGLHPEDKESAEKALQLAIAGKQKFDLQFRVIQPSGEIRFIKADALVIKNEHGEPVSMIGVNYDVTERVENELALTQAKLDAEAAARAKNEFLASMSHEIRTPMNGVVGMLGLLEDTPLDDEQKHRVTVAQSSANSLLSLINDILDFSKIDANKLELESITFNLPQMLGEFADSLAQQAQDKGLELILDTIGVSESLVLGDPNRLRQILTNLVSNAIKFTSEGEVLVKVTLTEKNENNWHLHIEVKDTGIGIAKDKQEQMFESFSQVDASTTRKFGGTGLGLAIVKKLCQCMGGDVRLESELGEGSRFYCDLIVGKALDSIPAMPAVDISKLKILIVDDNETNREVLTKQLAMWHATTESIADGFDAFARCEALVEQSPKELFDIAILDMQMPDIDGAQLGIKFRNDPRFDSMKMIMMTSISLQGDIKQFSKLGFSAYFPKPATTSDLFDALNIIVEDGEALKKAKGLITKDYINTLHSEEKIELLKAWPTNSRILLVEDNRVNQMVASGVLKKLGLSCDIAVNGHDALDKLLGAKDTYNLVLMDCQMPEMDGYEATQNIRAGKAGEDNSRIPIVAMTANAMQGDKEKCLDAGMDDYLVKPINKALLTEKLSYWLNT